MKSKIVKMLAAAMAVTMVALTPMSALAVEQNFVQEIYGSNAKQGTNSDSESDTDTQTDTVTNSETGDNAGQDGSKLGEVIGISIDPETVNIDKNGSARLKATVVTSEGEFIAGAEGHGTVGWMVTELSGNQDSGAVSVAKDAKDSREAVVTGLHGGTAVVRARIGGEYAYAVVNVKEYATELSFDTDTTPNYVKHTEDYSKLLKKVAPTSNDLITWEINKEAKSYASVDKNGVVTFKKVTDPMDSTKSKPVKEVSLTATSEQGKTATTKFVIELGNTTKKISLENSKDDAKSKLNIPTPDEKTVGVLLETNLAGVGTDIIKWTSSKPAIVRVTGQSAVEYVGEEDVKGKKVYTSKSNVSVEGLSVGTSKITGKTSSGKSVSFSVQVYADLSEIAISGDLNLYPGQTGQYAAVKNPVQNTDKDKWEVVGLGETDKDKKANKALISVSSKGLVTVKSKSIIEDTKVQIKVTSGIDVKPERTTTKTFSTGKTLQSNTFDITLKPSTATGIGSIVGLPKDFYVGQSVKLSAPVADGISEQITWKTSSTKVASVSNDGTIEGLKAGTATITASIYTAPIVTTDSKGKTKIKAGVIKKTTIKVPVKQRTTKLTINKTSNILYVDKTKDEITSKKTVSLSAKKLPTTSKEIVTWAVISDATLADGTTNVFDVPKATQGKITIAKGAKAGATATVVATAQSGATATATITVARKAKGVEVSAPDVTGDKDGSKSNKAYELMVGNSVGLTSLITSVTEGIPATETIASYSVSKKGIVTIVNSMKDGQLMATVYGVKPGTVTITVKTQSGLSDKFYVKVIPVTTPAPAN